MTEIKRVMLIKTCADVNSNKFWEAIVHDDGTVNCRWGRVGAAKGQSKSFGGGQTYVDKKIGEKLKKGYREAKVLTNSANSSQAVAQGSLKKIAAAQIKHSSPETLSLIEYLVKVNAHQITKASGGQLNVDAATGMIKTPLGILTQDGIDDARTILSTLSKLRTPAKRGTKQFKVSVQDYLMLVPQKIPSKRGWLDTMFPDTDSVLKQNALLDSLEATLSAIGSAPANTTPDEAVFSVRLTLTKDATTLKRVDKLYYDTRKRMHTSYRLKPHRVFEVSIDVMTAKFDADGAKVGNVKQLWHGTRASNLLSILKGGLIIPPSSSSNVTGRMYGDGIYFSDQSTKALNYAHGYWHGSYDNTCYMFLADVAMGKEYIPGGYGDRCNLPRKGFDSTFANGGTSGVGNNEMIVYRVSQCNLVYLVEFK